MSQKAILVYNFPNRSLYIEGSVHKGAMYKLNTYTKHVFAVCPRHDYSRLFVLKLERKKKSSSVPRQSHEHRQKEPPTNSSDENEPPCYMTE